MTFSKMEDKLYSNTRVCDNAQKRFFRRVPDSLESGTLRNENPDTPVCESATHSKLNLSKTGGKT
jgi:hypothetical protein